MSALMLSFIMSMPRFRIAVVITSPDLTDIASASFFTVIGTSKVTRLPDCGEDGPSTGRPRPGRGPDALGPLGAPPGVRRRRKRPASRSRSCPEVSCSRAPRSPRRSARFLSCASVGMTCGATSSFERKRRDSAFLTGVDWIFERSMKPTTLPWRLGVAEAGAVGACA